MTNYYCLDICFWPAHGCTLNAQNALFSVSFCSTCLSPRLFLASLPADFKGWHGYHLVIRHHMPIDMHITTRGTWTECDPNLAEGWKVYESLRRYVFRIPTDLMYLWYLYNLKITLEICGIGMNNGILRSPGLNFYNMSHKFLARAWGTVSRPVCLFAFKNINFSHELNHVKAAAIVAFRLRPQVSFFIMTPCVLWK